MVFSRCDQIHKASAGYAAGGLEGVLFFCARHASEQYFTSAQFLAQLLRQVISRPQATQCLLGRVALLPLKPVWPMSIQRVVVVMRVGAVVPAAQFHWHVLVGVGNALNT